MDIERLLAIVGAIAIALKAFTSALKDINDILNKNGKKKKRRSHKRKRQK